MDDSGIVWKEAKTHSQKLSREKFPANDSTEDSSNDEESSSNTGPAVRAALPPHRSINEEENDHMERDNYGLAAPDEFIPNPVTSLDPERTTVDASMDRHGPATRVTFSHRGIDLKLKRNITALADPAQHKPRLRLEESNIVGFPLHRWIDSAIVGISPNADMILFCGRKPERLVFLAKLRMEPICSYTTKTLNIPLDFDEHITCLMCIPIMSTQRTSVGSIDWTALAFGFSTGYLKFYTEQSICLLSLKFFDEPIMSLKLQTQKSNSIARSQTHFPSLVDELLVVYKSCAIVMDGIGLYENLRISKADVTKHTRENYEPAYSLDNLPVILTCQKWRFQSDSKHSRVLDAELLGTRFSTRFDVLKSNSINVQEYVPAKSLTRAIAVVGAGPFVSCYSEAKDQASHSYSEIITSLLPFWSKAQPTKFQLNEILRSSDLPLYDKDRLATSIIASPDKRLAAVTDDFGRVLLLDVTNWLLVRVWKGYRNAQCGWIEVKRNPKEKNTPYASFLVIYAPKRGLLEIWSVQRGPRVAAFNVGKNCRLLYSGYSMLNTRAEASARGQDSSASLLFNQSYSTNCYLLNAESETIFSIELPYTYSLYKFGDLKSRDHLLIGEISSAIDRNSDPDIISDILNRVSLAESLEICIRKISLELQPDMVKPIMESIIIKTMKNYDNNAGTAMSPDDSSIVELCKRVIRLCTMFEESADAIRSQPKISLPDPVSQRLIETYSEHPQEIDDFADYLGWSASEVLRCLSLQTLQQSYKRASSQGYSPFLPACFVEPLSWAEFLACFDLRRIAHKPGTVPQSTGDSVISIRLKDLSSKFLNEDSVIKTAVFIFQAASEIHYRYCLNSTKFEAPPTDDPSGHHRWYSFIEPSSRLALLFQFWLSTDLGTHWKMWSFMQHQVGQITDELRVSCMPSNDDDSLLIEAWRRVYQLILESDNLFAAIIATNVIKSDTLRMISDNEKREKLETNEAEESSRERKSGSLKAADWECLCIDVERMGLLIQQLEDVFLLKLLLNYSHMDKGIDDRRSFVFRIPRISVANILRGGPTIVSELVAQWAAQQPQNDTIDLSVFTESYGEIAQDEDGKPLERISISAEGGKVAKVKSSAREVRDFLARPKSAAGSPEEDQVKELLHHVRIAFPQSLDKDVILLHCLWEFCQRWTNGSIKSSYKTLLLQRAMDSLALLSCPLLQHNAASLALKAFFQRTLERLSLLIESHPTILSPKCLRSRDALARKELNMGEDCLEDYVRFCCNLSEFLLQTCHQTDGSSASTIKDHSVQPAKLAENQAMFSATTKKQNDELADKQGHFREQLKERLLCQDDWWSTPSVAIGVGQYTVDKNGSEEDCESNSRDFMPQTRPQATALMVPSLSSSSLLEHYQALRCAQDEAAARSIGKTPGDAAMDNNTLVRATLSDEKLFSINFLLEFNRLASLMDLIFKLRIIKSFPLTLIGEEARQTLKVELQQSESTGAEIQLRSGSLLELREKFARRCVVSIVGKLTDETEAQFPILDEEEVVDFESSKLSALSVDDERDERPMVEEKWASASGGGTGTKRSGSNKASKTALLAHSGTSGKQRLCPTESDEPDSKQVGSGAGGGGGIRAEPSSEKPWKKGTPLYDCCPDDDNHQNDDVVCSEMRRANMKLGLELLEESKQEEQQGQQQQQQQASSECLLLFANLMSLSNEWQLNCDELQLELVFELFRCNHDKLAKQLIHRIADKQMLALGLLKICSQRILVTFGLSPKRLGSTNQWKLRTDKWSLFQPSVSSWLKSIQEEEFHNQLAELSFNSSALVAAYPRDTNSKSVGQWAKSGGGKISTNYDEYCDADYDGRENNEQGEGEGTSATIGNEMDFLDYLEHSLGLRWSVLKALQIRTKSVLELITNYLEGQASRLAYDLLEVLETKLFEKKFLPLERKLFLDSLR